MTPADLLLAFLSRGPASRMALVGMLMGRGYTNALAEAEVGQAIFALTKVGRIESFAGDCFRLTEAATGAKDSRQADTEKIYGKKVRASGEASGVVGPGLNSDGSGQ